MSGSLSLFSLSLSILVYVSWSCSVQPLGVFWPHTNPRVIVVLRLGFPHLASVNRFIVIGPTVTIWRDTEGADEKSQHHKQWHLPNSNQVCQKQKSVHTMERHCDIVAIKPSELPSW
jgi:hypothetical protein